MRTNTSGSVAYQMLDRYAVEPSAGQIENNTEYSRSVVVAFDINGTFDDLLWSSFDKGISCFRYNIDYNYERIIRWWTINK